MREVRRVTSETFLSVMYGYHTLLGDMFAGSARGYNRPFAHFYGVVEVTKVGHKWTRVLAQTTTYEAAVTARRLLSGNA